jgi:predicted enzyme related to lactoylglutathione lyase
MNIKEIAFVCYAVTDFKKGRKFYEETLGLKPTSVFEKDGMGFAEYDLGNGALAIGSGAPHFKPGLGGATVAFEVADFDKAIQRLKESKVKFTMEAHNTGVCHMALVNDPDGNQIMIHKRKKD